MYLLDTNICIALLNENRKVVARFNHIPNLELENWLEP